jgi:hypothetical protein
LNYPTKYAKLVRERDNRVAGWADLSFLKNGGDAMKNQKNFDFKDLLAFGTFLLALLTFIFMFCK